MKIINASWEERNLGVTCCEVTIEKDVICTGGVVSLVFCSIFGYKG